MAATIGIKIANGEFYSIVEENSRVRKRLILTTVHNKQRSVQIDLYKTYTRTMADALYIGSLVVENIKPKPRGEPSIELVISSTAEGEIIADAVDLDSEPAGEKQTLNVSLKSLEEDTRDYDIPDFELESNGAPPSGLYEKAARAKESEKRPFPWLLVVLIALVLTALGIAAWLFFFRDRVETPPARPAQAERTLGGEERVPERTPVPPSPPETLPGPDLTPPPLVVPPPPVFTAPAVPPEEPPPESRERSLPPVSSYRVPTTLPRNGAPYTIRWGDTLWDISEAFYRNPWLYPRIARFNNIRNPDFIISGRTIRIPPVN